DGAVAQLADLRATGNGDLIHAVGAMSDNRAEGPEPLKYCCQDLGQVGSVYSNQLRVSAGRIGERTKHVEDSPDRHLTPHGGYVLHGGMKHLGEQNTYAYLVYAGGYLFSGDVDLYAQGFDHVYTAAQARH